MFLDIMHITIIVLGLILFVVSGMS